MSVLPQNLCQIEIPVKDVAKSLKFYEAVLGWKEAPCDIHGYRVLQVPQECPFGISLVPAAEAKGRARGMILYFAVEDVDVIANRAEALAERAFGKARKLPGYGTVRLIEDPDGHRIGLYHRSP